MQPIASSCLVLAPVTQLVCFDSTDNTPQTTVLRPVITALVMKPKVKAYISAPDCASVARVKTEPRVRESMHFLCSSSHNLRLVFPELALSAFSKALYKPEAL